VRAERGVEKLVTEASRGSRLYSNACPSGASKVDASRVVRGCKLFGTDACLDDESYQNRSHDITAESLPSKRSKHNEIRCYERHMTSELQE